MNPTLSVICLLLLARLNGSTDSTEIWHRFRQEYQDNFASCDYGWDENYGYLCPNESVWAKLPDFFRNWFCSCEPDCRQFGDCCMNVANFEDKLPEDEGRHKCLPIPGYESDEGIFMVAKCARDWDDASLDKFYCEADLDSSFLNAKVLLYTLPVHSQETNRFYKNVYCAICNRDNFNLTRWTFTSDPGCVLDRFDDVTYDKGSWILPASSASPGTKDTCRFRVEEFPQCERHYRDFERKFRSRSCLLPELYVTTCATKDSPDAVYCSKYQLTVGSRNRVYKNYHCLKCNGGLPEPDVGRCGVSFSTLCSIPEPERERPVPPRRTDYGLHGYAGVKGEIPEFGYGLHGYPGQKGEVGYVGFPTRHDTPIPAPSLSIILDFNAYGNGAVAPPSCGDGEIYLTAFSRCFSYHCGSRDRLGNECVRSIPARPRPKILHSPPRLSSRGHGVSMANPHSAPRGPSLSPPGLPLPDSGVPLNSPNTAQRDPTLSPPGTAPRSPTLSPNSLHDERIPSPNTPPRIPRLFLLFAENETSLNVQTVESDLNQSELINAEDTSTLKCHYVELNASEFTILDNETVLLVTGKYLYPNQYELKRTSNDLFNLLACVTQFPFQKTQYFFSLVCLIISVVCLCLHLAIYGLLPPLRNVPGLILMSFSGSLATADLLFVIGHFNQEYGSEICLVIGVLQHYFYLSVFLWSNVKAWYLRSTFHPSSLRPINHRRGTFVKYSVFAWSVPALVTLSAVGVDFWWADSDLSPGYGQGLCWINRKLPLVAFFVVPVGVMVLVNVILLTLTAINVSRIAKQTKMVNGLSDRRRFTLFLKLAAVLGLTWIFGFVAALANVDLLWYPFIVLSGLQGVYVFVAFTCNRKTRNLLREKFVGK